MSINAERKNDVPSEIATPRLLLRAFSIGDAEQLHFALSESIVQLREFLWFLPWVVEEQTLQSAKSRCITAQKNFKDRTDLPFLAIEKATGQIVASIGLHRTDWQAQKAEVGFWVRSSQVGKGYAAEGVNAVTACAIDKLGMVRVELVADEENHGSRAVAQHCGFQLEKIARNVEQAPDGSLRSNCVYIRLK